MLYRRPAIWLGAGFCRRRCFFTCLSATPCSFVRLLLHNPHSFCLLTCLFVTFRTFVHPLASPFGRGVRPNGLTERVLTFFILHSISKRGRWLPSQSQALWACASSPRGRAKCVGGGMGCGWKVGAFVPSINILSTHLPPPLGEVAGRTA